MSALQGIVSASEQLAAGVPGPGKPAYTAGSKAKAREGLSTKI